jgi:hypothetical protein
VYHTSFGHLGSCPAQSSLPAACHARAASAHSPWFRDTQSACRHSVIWQCYSAATRVRNGGPGPKLGASLNSIEHSGNAAPILLPCYLHIYCELEPLEIARTAFSFLTTSCSKPFQKSKYALFIFTDERLRQPRKLRRQKRVNNANIRSNVITQRRVTRLQSPRKKGEKVREPPLAPTTGVSRRGLHISTRTLGEQKKRSAESLKEQKKLDPCWATLHWSPLVTNTTRPPTFPPPPSPPSPSPPPAPPLCIKGGIYDLLPHSCHGKPCVWGP